MYSLEEKIPIHKVTYRYGVRQMNQYTGVDELYKYQKSIKTYSDDTYEYM